MTQHLFLDRVLIEEEDHGGRGGGRKSRALTTRNRGKGA
jgi:hypothetical protein